MIPLSKPVSHFQRRPALFVFIALACGIALGNAIADTLTVFRLSFILLFISLGVSFVFRKKNQLFPALAFVLSFAFGALLISHSRMDEENSTLAQYADTTTEEATLVGEIDDIRESKGLYIRLKCDSLVTTSRSIAVDEAAGIFLHNPDSPKQSSLKRGDKIKVFGQLAPFASQRNPYAFDYDEYLQRNERIHARIFCDSYYDITKTGERTPTLYDNIRDFFSSLRTEIKASISEIVTDTLTRGFILAMLLGDREALSDTVWSNFQQAGLTHLLVVSGFNLALVAWVFYYFLRHLRVVNRSVRIGLVMAGTLFFGFMVGVQPSVVRAVIFGEILLLGKLLERKPDLANIVSSAAIINLIIQPADLFNVGFQLSYGCVFSITLFVSVVEIQLQGAFSRFFKKRDLKNWDTIDIKTRKFSFHKALASALVVVLGTTPILLFHFHQAPLLSILTNLAAIPIASVATVLSVMLIPLSFISTWLAHLYADAVSMIFHVMAFIASLSKHIPFAVLNSPHPSFFFLVFYFLGLLYVLRTPFWKVATARFLSVCIIFFSFTSLGVGSSTSILPYKQLSVIFFDVGQGDAAMVTTPGGKSYVIDCGGISRAGQTYAERSMYPFLDAENIPAFAGAFATHMHLDHFGGFVSLARERHIDTLYTSGSRSALPEVYSLDSIAFAKRIPVKYLDHGDIITLDDGVKAYILNPEAVASEPVRNENSLVMKIVYGNTSVLFLGDISANVERELVARYGDFLKSNIVKAAHHGSRTSSSAELIAATQPAYAVFSSGRRNRHGHPHEEVVAAWQNAGAEISRTDREGALVFKSDQRTVQQVDWR